MEPLPGTLFGLNPDYLAVLRGLPGQAAKLWPSSTSLELALLRVLFVVAVAWMIRAYVLAPTIRYVKTMWRQLIVLSGLLSYLFLQVWLRRAVS